MSAKLAALCQLEGKVKEITDLRDFSLAVVRARISTGRLFKARGFSSFSSYISARRDLFGITARQACRLVRGAHILDLLRSHERPPSSEKQVRLSALGSADLQILNGGPSLPYTVQIRSLVSCTRETATAVWDEAVRTSLLTGRPVTASSVVAQQKLLDLRKSTSTSNNLPVQLKSGTVEWYTPPYLLELVREVFSPGIIDLDPCSCPQAQELVKACHYFTQGSDGLGQGWYGRVYVNPPFGATAGQSRQDEDATRRLVCRLQCSH